MKQLGFSMVLELMITVIVTAIVSGFVVALMYNQPGGSSAAPGDVILVNPDGSTSIVPGAETTEGEPATKQQKQQTMAGIIIAVVISLLLLIVVVIAVRPRKKEDWRNGMRGY